MTGAQLRRSPYWRPGDVTGAEPWTALVVTSTGDMIVPCGRNAEHAHAMLRRWRVLAEQGGGWIDLVRIAVAAAVVDPHGDVVDAWSADGHERPTPGAPSRWPRLHSISVPSACAGCGASRWPGCWVAVDMPGCGLCLPACEVDDPRPAWPADPPAPPELVAARVRAARKTGGVAEEVATALPQLDSPDDGRLL